MCGSPTTFIIAAPCGLRVNNNGSNLVPIYEYRCDACSHELEKLQRMNDDLLLECPACYRPALKRLVSAAAFRLKGSGWYETDFKKDNKRNLAESTKKDEETADKTSADSDSKKTDKPSTASTDKKSTASAATKPNKAPSGNSDVT